MVTGDDVTEEQWKAEEQAYARHGVPVCGRIVRGEDGKHWCGGCGREFPEPPPGTGGPRHHLKTGIRRGGTYA